MSVTFDAFPLQVTLVHKHAMKINGNVALPHKAEYSLVIHNHTDRFASAEVYVGKDLAGKVAMAPHQTFPMNCKIGDSRQFTFVRLDSDESKAAGVNPESTFNGLIKVVYIVEKAKEVHSYHTAPPQMQLQSYGGQLSGAMSSGSQRKRVYRGAFKPKQPTPSVGTTLYGDIVKEPTYGYRAPISDPDLTFSRTIQFHLVEAAYALST